MTKIIDRLKAWPTNNAGQPLMNTSEEAIFYGTLIYDKPDQVKEIKKLRGETVEEVSVRMNRKDVNLDLLMILAVKGQFFRECLEEVDRLNNQAFHLSEGGE